MSDGNPSRFSLVRHGARRHFAVGVALMAVLPSLALGYLVAMDLIGVEVPWAVRLALSAAVPANGILGFVVLREYPDSVAKLRDYTRRMADGGLPEDMALAAGENDIAAIEGSMKQIVERLRQRVDTLEVERSALEQRLHQAQKMAGMGVMAGGIVRDLGGLLGGIQSQVEVLRDALVAGSAQWGCVDEIAQKVEKGWALARQLDLYGTGRGAEMSEFDLAPALREIIGLLEVYVLEKTALTHDLPLGLPTIQGDVMRVQQIATNLIMNALDAVGEEGGAVSVSLAFRDLTEADLADAQPAAQVRSGRYACLAVADSGRGMGAEEKARVFDPFFSTKPGHRGTGLADVLGIVRAHDGLVQVESEPGKGSTFRVLFPVADA